MCYIIFSWARFVVASTLLCIVVLQAGLLYKTHYLSDFSKLEDLLHLVQSGALNCSSRQNCAKLVVETVLSVEEELKSLSQGLIMQTHFSVTKQNYQVETLFVDCVNVTKNCNAHFALRGLVYYLQAAEVSDYFVTAAQFEMQSQVSTYLIDHARVENHVNVVYVIASETIPYLSVAGYDNNDSAITKASVNFFWNGSDITVIDEVAQIIRSTKNDVRVRSVLPRCHFIDTTELKFSERGCRTLIANISGSISSVQCDCSHTTVFAILLSVSAQVVPLGVKICSYVTETLSVVFLVATVVTLVRYKARIKSDRTMIQINLSISLLSFHFILLFHDLFRKIDVLCVAAAVATHFLLLSTAMWMAVEGVRLHLRTSNDVLRYGTSSPTKQIVINLGLGWGIPFFVTSVFVAIGWTLDSYMKLNYVHKMGTGAGLPKYDICWIDSSSPIYFASVVAPISIALTFNFVITCNVLVTLIRLNSYTSNLLQASSKNLSNTKATFKALFILLTLLGIPWIIGFFTGMDSFSGSVVMMYLNTIVNGLQGCFVFLLYCLFNPTLRHKIESSTSHPTLFKSSSAYN